MIEISEKSIKLWSTVGPRATVGLVLSEIAKTRSDLMVVTADVSSSAGLERFSKQFPKQYCDVGIAEQNMISVAAGLADNGFAVVTTTFAPFQTLRCLDQIKINLAYSEKNVTMIGLASGLINGPLGNTHCCIEDVGALRSIPNITIVSPADGFGVARSIEQSLTGNTSTYIRLTGGANNPVVYQSNVPYETGIANRLTDGSDVAIFACGTAVHTCLQAAKIVSELGISAATYDMHTIKPIDREIIKKTAKTHRLLVSVEEHNVIGGLGSAISEILSDISGSPQLLTLGVEDNFLKPGSYKYMLEQCGLNPQAVADAICRALHQEKNHK